METIVCCSGDWELQGDYMPSECVDWFRELPVDVLKYFLRSFVQNIKDLHSLIATSKRMYKLILSLDFWSDKQIKLNSDHEVKSIAFERYRNVRSITLIGSPTDSHVFSFLSGQLGTIETLKVQTPISGQDLIVRSLSYSHLDIDIILSKIKRFDGREWKTDFR
jgi:hypothetical protein